MAVEASQVPLVLHPGLGSSNAAVRTEMHPAPAPTAVPRPPASVTRCLGNWVGPGRRGLQPSGPAPGRAAATRVSGQVLLATERGSTCCCCRGRSEDCGAGTPPSRRPTLPAPERALPAGGDCGSGGRGSGGEETRCAPASRRKLAAPSAEAGGAGTL